MILFVFIVSSPVHSCHFTRIADENSFVVVRNMGVQILPGWESLATGVTSTGDSSYAFFDMFSYKTSFTCSFLHALHCHTPWSFRVNTANWKSISLSVLNWITSFHVPSFIFIALMSSFKLVMFSEHTSSVKLLMFLGSMLPQYMALCVSFVCVSKKNLGHFCKVGGWDLVCWLFLQI